MKDKLKYDKYVDNKNYYQIKVNRIASVRLIIFMMMLISFIAKYYYYSRIFSFVFISCLVIFLLLVFIHDYYFKKFDYYVKCVEVINRYLARENGEWKHFKDKGDDFLKDAPYYYSDLDIFGNNSLFQYLSICRTLGGRRLLKDRLSNIQFSSNKLALEQDAVKEISEHTSFLVDLECLLLSFEDKNVDLSKDYSLSFDKVDYVNLFISIIFSVFSILFFCLGIFGVISIHYFYGIFLFNYMISTLFSSIYKNDFSCLEKMIISYRGVDSIIQRTLNEDFSSKKLKNIQNNFKNSLVSRDSLKRLDTIYSFRSNFISNFILNGFCCINFIFIFLFQCFKKKDLSQIKMVMHDIEELEVIGSLSCVGVVFSNKCMPILMDEVGIHFDGLIHPLLGENVCVANDFDSSSGVNIITGSNMGGKTSFLRTVGMNIILMNSGSFVCANSFSACYFKIFTSMRVNDDISNGISTFYGELLRIKDMVDYVESGNMLALIDEIFKGTNYQDRIYGAKEVIRRLNTNMSVVLLTTHDFELCDEKNVHNYFVQEAYEGDKIVFDYKIRSGKCSSTNARYLMKKLGITKK